MQIISLIQGLWAALIILMFFVKLRTGICHPHNRLKNSREMWCGGK
jgi:hypothetical protein